MVPRNTTTADFTREAGGRYNVPYDFFLAFFIQI